MIGKSTYIGITIAFLLSLSVPILYLNGFIQFNYPSQNDFPISGVDVSHHQGKIDWIELKKSRIAFAFIKATEGGDWKDSRFQSNWKESQKAGFIIGAYHFFTFCKSGKVQALNFISSVPKKKNTLPPAIDIEFHGNCKKRPSKRELIKELEDCVQIIRREYGKDPIIYTTSHCYKTYLVGEVPNCKIWIRDIFFEPELPDHRDWLFWQYHDRGKRKGIAGFVDLNVFKGTKLECVQLLNPLISTRKGEAS